MNTETTIQLPWNLLACASTDATRYSLLGALIDPIDRAVVVTDGRRCVIHPIPGDAPIKKGYITHDMVKMAKIKNKTGMFLDYEAGILNDIPTDYDEEKIGNYPNWRAIDPTFSACYRISLNPTLLAGIVAALGVAKDTSICLEFDTDGTAPLRILSGGSRGILMPMRGDEEAGLLVQSGGINADALKKQLAAANAKITELSERSDNNNPGHSPDESLITALRTEMLQARARVKELEAILAKSHASPTGNASPADPKVKPLDPKPREKIKAEVPYATAPPVLSRNEERNGIELRFNGKPDPDTHGQLLAHKWKWSPGQPGQPWYCKYTEEQWVFAHGLAEGTTPAPMPEESPQETPANVTPMPVPSRLRKIEIPEF